jgi:hypothetical protein
MVTYTTLELLRTIVAAAYICVPAVLLLLCTYMSQWLDATPRELEPAPADPRCAAQRDRYAVAAASTLLRAVAVRRRAYEAPSAAARQMLSDTADELAHRAMYLKRMADTWHELAHCRT